MLEALVLKILARSVRAERCWYWRWCSGESRCGSWSVRRRVSSAWMVVSAAFIIGKVNVTYPFCSCLCGDKLVTHVVMQLWDGVPADSASICS